MKPWVIGAADAVIFASGTAYAAIVASGAAGATIVASPTASRPVAAPAAIAAPLAIAKSGSSGTASGKEDVCNAVAACDSGSTTTFSTPESSNARRS